MTDSYTFVSARTSLSGAYGELRIDPAGLYVFVIIDSGSSYVYRSSLSIPHNINSAGTFSPSYISGANVLGLFLSSDGTELWVKSTNAVSLYSLSTPWDIGTKTYVGYLDTGYFSGGPLVVNPTRDRVYLVDGGDIEEYTIASSGIPTGSKTYVKAMDSFTSVIAFDIASDGKSVYILAYVSPYYLPFKATISTAWDLSTMSTFEAMALDATDKSYLGITISADLSKLYVIREDYSTSSNRQIREYDVQSSLSVFWTNFKDQTETI